MSAYDNKPIYFHIASETCRCCGKEIISADLIACKEPRWIVHSTTTQKNGQVRVYLIQACDVCSDMDIALKEADEACRRYTSISTFNSDCEHGRRCMCGAVSVGIYSRCVRCSIANRMLDKAQAEARLLSRLLVDLRKQAKHSLKEQLHGS